jgi:ribosomal protein L37E
MSHSTIVRTAHGESKRDIDASLCKRAPIMVTRGVCPRCGGRAFYNAEGWSCAACCWVQYTDFVTRAPAVNPHAWPPVWAEKSNHE